MAISVERLKNAAMAVAARTGPDIQSADVARWLRKANTKSWMFLAAMAGTAMPTQEVKESVVKLLENDR